MFCRLLNLPRARSRTCMQGRWASCISRRMSNRLLGLLDGHAQATRANAAQMRRLMCSDHAASYFAHLRLKHSHPAPPSNQSLIGRGPDRERPRLRGGRGELRGAPSSALSLSVVLLLSSVFPLRMKPQLAKHVISTQLLRLRFVSAHSCSSSLLC